MPNDRVFLVDLSQVVSGKKQPSFLLYINGRTRLGAAAVILIIHVLGYLTRRAMFTVVALFIIFLMCMCVRTHVVVKQTPLAIYLVQSH